MTEITSAISVARTKVINQAKIFLSDNIIDLELTEENYNYAVDAALQKYRQRAENANEEANVFFELQPNQNEYTLPEEIVEIRKIWRRGIGSSTSASGPNFDPFSAAATNYYLLGAARPGSSSGGLLTYELSIQYISLAGRMFGRDIDFLWNHMTRKFQVIRAPRAREECILQCWKKVPDDLIIADTYAGNWIRDYTIAQCKFMLGSARSLFGSLPGPQGGVTMNGDALKAEAKEEMAQLEKYIIDFNTGALPIGSCIIYG